MCDWAQSGGHALAEAHHPDVGALYRVRASIRAAELRDWLKSDGVLAPAALASAELRAAIVDLSTGEIAGLAVDWSKCYDRVPLATGEAVARAACVHSAVWRSMLAAYATPRQDRCGGSRRDALRRRTCYR